MKRVLFFIIEIVVVSAAVLFTCCGDPINSVNDPRFDEDGIFLKDTLELPDLKPMHPSKIKFFVEVSGSMNGFFRANAPTKFKEDVWRVISYYEPVAEDITILTNEGDAGTSVSISSFQNQMNTGAFVSSASTKVPLMLQTILNSIDAESGEVAVLISDMKYSPVGSAAPQVLLTQYSTDISKIFGKYGKAISLIGAKSQFLDKNGNAICSESPYYFLVIGNSAQVADIRNGISTLVDNNGNFIDNIDSGMEFGAPTYSFGIPQNCFQLDNEPTFTGYEESGDTCIVKLKVNLENYRWITSHEDIFPKTFQCKTLYGSEIKIGDINYHIENITNKELQRTAFAEIDLKIFNMAMDAEVIEWTLLLPDMDITNFEPYLNATDENDYTKSYSLENFIKGMFYGGVVNKTLKPNYILISKNS